jgi:hypothetical protein
MCDSTRVLLDVYVVLFVQIIEALQFPLLRMSKTRQHDRRADAFAAQNSDCCMRTTPSFPLVYICPIPDFDNDRRERDQLTRR